MEWDPTITAVSHGADRVFQVADAYWDSLRVHTGAHQVQPCHSAPHSECPLLLHSTKESVPPP